MIWTDENIALLYSDTPDRQLAFELGTTEYQVHKKRGELNLHRVNSFRSPELYTEDINKLFHSLYIGQDVSITIPIYGLGVDFKKDVRAIIKELFPHHALCEYEGKIYSIQLKDIASKNRGLM